MNKKLQKSILFILVLNHNRNLEIAKLNQELQLLKEELRSRDNIKSAENIKSGDKLTAIGSVRKDKELREVQSECEILKNELDRLRSENEMLKINQKEEPKSAEQLKRECMPRSAKEAMFSVDEQDDENKKAEEGFGASIGSGTLKSSISELTKSQKLVIENVFLAKLYKKNR